MINQNLSKGSITEGSEIKKIVSKKWSFNKRNNTKIRKLQRGKPFGSLMLLKLKDLLTLITSITFIMYFKCFVDLGDQWTFSYWSKLWGIFLDEQVLSEENQQSNDWEQLFASRDGEYSKWFYASVTILTS